jgi:hypothetical protein
MLYIPATRKRADKLIHGRRGRAGNKHGSARRFSSPPILIFTITTPLQTPLSSLLLLSAQGSAPRLASHHSTPPPFDSLRRHISPPLASSSSLTSLRQPVGGAASSPVISSAGRTSSSREQRTGASTATHRPHIYFAGRTAVAGSKPRRLISAGPGGCALCCSSRTAGSK